ncbi:MAG: hypothetical protein ACLP62_06385 [Acidimicrobiales bacterium]
MVGPASADWVTISSLATAAGTLVLAAATFAAVRSSNRSARIAEIALQEQRRPLLAPSRPDDPQQKIMFLDGQWVRAAGGRAVVEHVNDVVYMAISLRNVGTGMAVCQGWSARPGMSISGAFPSHTPLEEFHLQSRDLYVPGGDVGLWQGALRHPDDPLRVALVEAVASQQPVTVELLYSDQVGHQRTVSRFALIPANDSWLATMTRHWYLDWEGPRPEPITLAAAEAVLRDHRASVERRVGSEGADETTGAPTDSEAPST